MAERIVQEESLVAVADAIRAKGGTTDPLSFPTGFADAIAAIQAGASIDNGIVWTEINSAYQPTKATIYATKRVPKYACYGMDSLSSVVFQGNPTSLMDYCFSGCRNLSAIELPSSVDTLDARSFNGCTSMTTLKAEGLGWVNNDAFYGCSKLTLVDIKGEGFGSQAFYNCSKLVSLILRGNALAKLYNTNSFTGTPIANGAGYIYVQSVLVDSYKAATNWSAYANQFRALEDYTVDGTTTGALDESKI